MKKFLLCYLAASLLIPSFYCNASNVLQETADVTIEENKVEEVLPTELDLGDYQTEMTIGEKQLLTVTVLPETATSQELTYQSSNTSVATINGMGRITAVGEGTTQITVTCGTVMESFPLTVSEEVSETEETIAVQDIEIGDYEEELKVDATLTLSATVLPSDATDATVTYQSSNTQIATVNSSGEVKGIAPGQVVISVTAGGVTKQVPITVKIATTAIVLNSDYRVMKPGDTFQISPSVEPAGAAGSMTYKSLNNAVATVSGSGLITAKACGNTAIVVSNGDLQVSVTVIVNENGSTAEEENEPLQVSGGQETILPEVISVQDYPVLTSAMLKYLYENKKSITIIGENYTIYLNGADIVNTANQLKTELFFQEAEHGFSFCVNENQKLCGKITLDISPKVTNQKYLYLYSNQKEAYQKLSTSNIKVLVIDTEGTYLLTAEKIAGLRVKKALAGGGCILILLAGGIYIGVKRQYWFW
ncbi:MAG: Ig-like domain-containing protein [Roseburia sp.]